MTVPAPLVDLDWREFQLCSNFLYEAVRPVLLLDVELQEASVLFVCFHHVLPLLRIVLHDLITVILRDGCLGQDFGHGCFGRVRDTGTFTLTDVVFSVAGNGFLLRSWVVI